MYSRWAASVGPSHYLDPVLLTGDASHTRWGWENGVEPGPFSEDLPKSAESLARLRKLAAEHPTMQVLVSHQP